MSFLVRKRENMTIIYIHVSQNIGLVQTDGSGISKGHSLEMLQTNYHRYWSTQGYLCPQI